MQKVYLKDREVWFRKKGDEERVKRHEQSKKRAERGTQKEGEGHHVRVIREA